MRLYVIAPPRRFPALRRDRRHTSREASKRSRAHAQAALTILERRAALPPAVKTPLNYAFFVDASKKLLRR